MVALRDLWWRSGSAPMRVNLRGRSDDRAGRARLSETAGSSATHHPIWPNAFASGNGSRPNRVQLRPRSYGLRETRPTCSVAQTLPKIMRSFSLGCHLKLTRMGGCPAAAGSSGAHYLVKPRNSKRSGSFTLAPESSRLGVVARKVCDRVMASDGDCAP